MYCLHSILVEVLITLSNILTPAEFQEIFFITQKKILSCSAVETMNSDNKSQDLSGEHHAPANSDCR